MAGNNDPNKKADASGALVALIVLLFLGGGSWVAYKFFYHPTPKIDPTPMPVVENDPLCIAVEHKQLLCVAGLASENLLGPGHFVAYAPSASAGSKVPFPDGDLFSRSCLVPGEQANNLLASLNRQESENAVAFEEITYKLDKSFQVGANLPFPKLHDLTFKAGPKLSAAREIAMKADNAFLKIIDVNVLRDVVGHAGIRKICLDSIVNGQYSVISKALIARSIKVDVKDKSGRSIDLSAAATAGQVTVSGGASAGANVEQDIRTSMATPMVLGVFFFPASVFSTEAAFTEPVVFSPSGELTATVSGNGGQGALPQQSRTVKINEPLAINQQGGESSDCNGGFERTYSMSILNGGVVAPDPQTFEVTLNGTIGGGHYATGACIGGTTRGYKRA